MYSVRVGKLACFTGEGLGVAFADFEIPICIVRYSATRTPIIERKRDKIEFFLLVLLSPPALAGTLSGSLIIFAAW